MDSGISGIRPQTPEVGNSAFPGTAGRLLSCWPWLTAAASGVLLTLAFPRWNQGWLAWFALIPLLAAVWFSPKPAKRKWLRDASLGYVAGLIFFWWAFSWLTTVTGIGWFALAFYMALYVAAWAVIAGACVPHDVHFLRSGNNLLVALVCASAWTGLELIRGRLFTGFGWNNLGVALHEDLPMIQIAEFTGVGGLSFLAAFTNVVGLITVRRFIAEIARTRLRAHYDFTVMMALIALVFGFGVRRLFEKPEGTPLTVAAVQPNIPQVQKWDPAFEQQIHGRLDSLTRVAAALDPQLILWPESATPRGIFGDEQNFNFTVGLAGLGKYDLLLGSDDFDESGDYNATVLLTRGGKAAQVYRKMHLVPFGEFIPFRHSFPLFAWIAGDLVPGDFAAGREPVVLQMESAPIRIGPLICFEDTLGDLTRQFVQKGAQVLVNVTNDGWFLKSQASEQHLANAVFRAIENRRPLLRCANTGVTCFIDRYGRIPPEHILRTPEEGTFTEGTLMGRVEIPANGKTTFYTRHGDLFSMATFPCLLLLAVIRRKPREK